jgi:peptide/nickel transport system substrate-binding protein
MGVGAAGPLSLARRRVKLNIGAAAVMALLALGAAACGSGGGESGANSVGAKRPLRIGIVATAIDSLNPAKSYVGTVFTFSYEPLIERKPDGSLGPGLARSWRYFETGRGANTGFELTLRTGARFSDGTPVTAKTVKESIDYFQRSRGPGSSLLDVSSVEAIGTSTVRIRLGTPNPDVPNILSQQSTAGMMIGPRAVANPKLLSLGSLGAGPYVLDGSQSIANDHYTFLPNRYYYDKSKVKWSKVTIKLVPSHSSLLQAMQAGEIDVGQGDYTTAPQAEKLGLQVAASLVEVTSLNLADREGTVVKPLADVRVRQALSYAIDRQKMCTALYGKYGAPTSLPEETRDGSDPALRNYYSYDPEKAKSLLAAAGYPQGFKLPIWGGPPSFPTAPVQPVVVRYLEDVGIKVNFQSGNEFFDKIFARSAPAYFIVTDAETTANAMDTFYRASSPFNPFKVDDPVIRKLYDQGIRARDPSPVWKELYRHIVTDGVSLGLCRWAIIFYAAKDVGGLNLTGSNLYTRGLFPRS